VLSKELEQVLAEVRGVVADFEPMKAKVRSCWKGRRQRLWPRQKKRPKELPRMAGGNHFTFLGYEEFTVRDEAGRRSYGIRRQLVLGLTKPAARRPHRRRPAHRRLRRRLPARAAPAVVRQGPHPSRVHRPAYPDYVSIRQIDADGKVIKECRFMGLYTSSVYGESVQVIPYIRRKVAEIERRSHFEPRRTWARNWPRWSKCCRATTCSRPRSMSCSAP
jgi:glutamate dehydrogenase